MARVNLGDRLSQNIVETVDYRALGFTGTIIGGAVNSGDLEANDTSGEMWVTSENLFYTADSQPMWGPAGEAMFAGDQKSMWGDESDLMYDDATYPKLTYIDTFTPTVAGALLIESTPRGPLSLEYSRKFPDDMFTSDESEMWGLDGDLMWNERTSFLPWTGRVFVQKEEHEIRAIVAGGPIRGEIQQLKAIIDAPDVIERFDDVAIGAGGTRLSIEKTYASIHNVNLTLQDDGGAAVIARVMDKNATSGPLIQCFDSSDVAVAGTVDATVQGV